MLIGSFLKRNMIEGWCNVIEYTEEQREIHRKQWVEALESGKYKQGFIVLRHDDGYCCLGVACDISGLGEWVKELHSDDYQYVIKQGDSAYVSLLGQEVMNWLGLTDSLGAYFGISEEKSLSDFNDNGISFDEIAKVIRNKPLGLFVEVKENEKV